MGATMAQARTRILSRRTAPFPPFPHSLPRPAWLYPKILVLTPIASTTPAGMLSLELESKGMGWVDTISLALANVSDAAAQH